MKLNHACCKILKYKEYWAQMEIPSLESFLRYRQGSQQSPITDKKAEHRSYERELQVILSFYPAKNRIHKTISEALKSFRLEAKSPVVKVFWTQQEELKSLKEAASIEMERLKTIKLRGATLLLERGNDYLNQSAITTQALQAETVQAFFSQAEHGKHYGNDQQNENVSFSSELKEINQRDQSNKRKAALFDKEDEDDKESTEEAPEQEMNWSDEEQPLARERDLSNGKRSRYEEQDIGHNASSTILTPNKPSISRSMYNKYSSAHIICAFRATLNYIKTTKDEHFYEEIKKKLEAGNQSVLTESLTTKLGAILDMEYSDIEEAIIREIPSKGKDQMDDERFNFFVRYSLLDFVANFKYRTPRVLPRDISERTFIVESLSPIFRSFRNAFTDIRYEWIEKDIDSIKDVNKMFTVKLRSRRADILTLRLSDGREIMSIEVSGPPFRTREVHTVGDVKKLLMVAVCNLCRLFGNFLDCDIEDAKKMKTYSIQVVGDRLTLFSVSLIGREEYLAIELASCMIPFTFDDIKCYIKIFNLFAILRNELVEQEKLRKRLYSSISSSPSSSVREWLHIDEDLEPKSDAVDEIVM